MRPGPLRILSFLLLAGAAGCADESGSLSQPTLPPAPETDDDDDDVEVELAPVSTDLCGFEDNVLDGFGLPGESEDLPDEGGHIVIVREAWDFSALVGEEELDFPGLRAVMLRSSGEGEQDSVAVLTTNPFVPQHPVFVMEQLSEVGEEGIALDLWVLDEDGELLEERELPVHTGGYVPALMPFHDPIEAFPEIDTESAQLGEFTRSLVDVEDYADQTIQLQFRQHTRIEGNGFFTLLDNLCDGEPTDLD